MTEYQFGRALCDMYDVLTTTQSGLPRLPPKVQSAQSSFMSMGDEWGLGYSDLGSVYNYLCRGKHLVILEEWRHLGPKTLRLEVMCCPLCVPRGSHCCVWTDF